MEQMNIPYNKKRESSLEKEFSGSEEIDEKDLVFIVDLELGKADRTGERKMIKGVCFDKGACFIIENGIKKQVPFIEAGVLVLKYNRQNSLTEAQKWALGIDKLLAKKN